MIEENLLSTDEKMKKAIEALRRELAAIRTGRATPALVDHIKVDNYGALTPLNHLATISVPEAKLITIQPWDRRNLDPIQKAILKSDLGLNPMSDGNMLRLTVPPLTEERRRELVKMVHRRVEEGKVTVRNLRRESMDELREKEKKKEISQDEHKRASEKLQKLTDGFINEVDQAGQDKERELMEI